MKIAVIGLGSMGKRRIRILTGILKGASFGNTIIGIDTRQDRREEAAREFGINTAGSLEPCNDGHKGVAFVCTSPDAHYTVIKNCLELDFHVFSELSLVSDAYGQNKWLSEEKGLVLFPSSTMRYRDETRAIIAECRRSNGRINYIYHVGQYLPDWHPWESYRDFFAGKKRTNGCRELLAVELPWIIEAFGPVKSVDSIHDRISSLDIDYDDNYLVRIEHENGCKGILAIDVVSRQPVRDFTAYAEHMQIRWEGTPERIQIWDSGTNSMHPLRFGTAYRHQEGYQHTIIENAYEREIEDFLAVVKKERSQTYTVDDDLCILGWIDKIENGEKHLLSSSGLL